MGKMSLCLKYSFITVVTLIAIISTLLLAITLFGHGHIHAKEELSPQIQTAFYGLYGISIATLLFAISGVFGACQKKTWALILFAVGMILSSLFIFWIEVNGLTRKPEIIKQLKMAYLDFLPLSNSSEGFKEFLNAVQMDLQCCGVDQGYLDWEYNIPKSCMCTQESTNPCVEAPIDRILLEQISDQPIMIYKEPCLPYLIARELMSVNVMLGVMLGLTLLWVSSIILSVFILCQMTQKKDTPAVVYRAKAKAGNYTTLAELT